MLGAARVKESEQAQLAARGLPAGTILRATAPDKPFFPSGASADPQVSAAEFSSDAVTEVFARTRKTGNHVCKPAVCHKGRLGKQGFCRMYYWH